MKFSVVPEPSARTATVMAWSGSVTSGLSAAMAGSFQFVIWRWKILATTVGVSWSVVDVGQVVGERDRREDGREVEELAALELG